ncbi:MAG: efflux RND transporter periplasmic adaptor subunit [Gammaproteobacteria bacterium]|jgi:multidrug efflux system membrane fusion protein
MTARAFLSALLLFVTLPALAADLPATIGWSRRVVLSTPVSGIVTTVNATPGQHVRKGDLLVALDPRPLKAAVTEAQADVRRLTVAGAEAKREYERAQELYDRTVISKHDLQLAEIAAVEANSKTTAAHSRLVQARVRLENSEIRAPFDGLVIGVHTAPGETVANRLQVSPMVILAADRPLLATAWAEAPQLAKLKTGQSVQVTVQGQNYPATVTALGLEPQNRNGKAAYAVRASFSPPKNLLLRAGESATLILP